MREWTRMRESEWIEKVDASGNTAGDQRTLLSAAPQGPFREIKKFGKWSLNCVSRTTGTKRTQSVGYTMNTTVGDKEIVRRKDGQKSRMRRRVWGRMGG